MPKVRLIAMDMDGTLLNREGQIPPENIAALRAAEKMGVRFAICSGRFPENASTVVMEAGLSCPVIGTNGAEIIDAPMGKLLYLKKMLPEAARQVNEVLLKMNASYFTFAHKLITTSEEEKKHHSELTGGDMLQKQGRVRFTHGREAILAALKEGVNKFFVSDTGNLPQIREALLSIEGISLTRSSPRNIEVMPEGVHKGTGVAELARHFGIDMAQVMALGDQDNDLPMLECVGFGVAMGNAPDEIKRRVQYETARFDEFGVARAIERFVLNA